MRRPLTVATIGRHYFSIGRQNNRECRDEAAKAIRPEYLRVAPSLSLITSFMRMVGRIALWKSSLARLFGEPRWIADGGSSPIKLIPKPRMKSRKEYEPKARKAGAGSNTISVAIRVPMATFQFGKKASLGFWERLLLKFASGLFGRYPSGPFWESWVLATALGLPFGLTRVDRLGLTSSDSTPFCQIFRDCRERN